MTGSREGLRSSLRIVWAITAKDIIDAMKNKTTLSVMLTLLFLVVLYQYLPALTSGDQPPRLVVYDADSSPLVTELEDSTQFDLRKMLSQQQMEEYLGNMDSVVLGLVLPADFDQYLRSNEQLELDGYVIHWASDSATAQVQTFFEGQLTELVGKPVRIDVAGNTVYTQKDSTGYAFLTSISVILVLTMIGISMTPNLMLEEKRTKTLDVLLVSPASTGQVVIGKALTGLFYCLTTAVVVLAFNAALITHWGLAILAVTCGSLLCVALGLLLGSVFEVKQQLTIWGFLLFQPLLLPMFLSIMEDLMPRGLIVAFDWIPTVALSKVLRVSFSNSAPLAEFGPELALVAGCAALVLAAVAWVVRRSDR